VCYVMVSRLVQSNCNDIVRCNFTFGEMLGEQSYCVNGELIRQPAFIDQCLCIFNVM
jgi:hypothetical protein